MNHPLHEEFTSYRQFVTTTWSKPPAILQELINHLKECEGTFDESPIDTEHINALRAAQLSFNLQHVCIGLQGEALEVYLEDDLKEELGDILYYLTQGSNFLDIKTEDILQVCTAEMNNPLTELHVLIRPLLQNVETLCNLLKKVYIYYQPLHIHQLGITHHTLNLYCLLVCAAPFQEVMRENRAKLEERYPSGFSTQASIERADKCVD